MLRRQAEEQLLGAAEAGAEQGGVALDLSFLEAAGIPLSASLLISRVHRRFDSLDAVSALRGRGEAALVRLPDPDARPADDARRRPWDPTLGSEFEHTIAEYSCPYRIRTRY